MAKPFVSTSTVKEGIGLRAAGLEPVGMVMGACVMSAANMNLSGWDYYADEPFASVFAEALATSAQRLIEEAVEVGAAIVADIEFRLQVNHPFDTDFFVPIQLIGTGYRWNNRAVPHPILTNLQGTDLSLLLRSGFVPLGLCIGQAMAIQMPGYRSSNYVPFTSFEHPDYTQAIYNATGTVRSQMEAQAMGLNADGMLGFQFLSRNAIRYENGGVVFQYLATATAVKRDTFPHDPVPAPEFVIDLSS